MFEDLTPKYTKTIDPKLFINQDFVSQFMCPLCEGVLNEPSMELCGCMKLFCKNCLNQYLKHNNNKCPISGDKIIKEPKLIDWVQNSLKLLDIKCKNYEEGCKWIGKYSKYNDHLKQCLKEPTHCINEGCNKIFLRENLENHIKDCQYRSISCNKCGMKIKYSEKDKHDDLCSKKEIKCPQNCGASFERCKLNEHKTKCPNTFIPCPFEKVGCKEKISRNNKNIKNDQNNNYNHINLLLNDYLLFKEKIINIFNLKKEEFDFSKINNNENKINNNSINTDSEIKSNYIIINDETNKQKNENEKKEKSDDSNTNQINHEEKIKDTNTSSQKKISEQIHNNKNSYYNINENNI